MSHNGVMTSPLDAAAIRSVTEIFATRFARGTAPSSAWGIFDRTGLLHSGTTGQQPNGAEVTAHTAYRIASCTKSFTAAAILALRDEGSLHLDQPITDFYPLFGEVALPSPDSPVPTLRMLLTMSAGFPTDNPWGDRQESLTDDEFDAFIREGITFDSVPGTAFEYSNLGYALLGRVIAVVSGGCYRQFVADRFLTPLGLTETGFDEHTPASGGIARGCWWEDTGWSTLSLSGPGAFSAIGGLFSTITDLATWAAWLADAFDADNPAAVPSAPEPKEPHAHDALLSRASRRELQQLQRFASATPHTSGYGLGLFVEHYAGDAISSHSGGYPGYSAHMRWSQKTGLGVVAYENATFSNVAVGVTQALDLLLAGASTTTANQLPTKTAHSARPDVPVVVWPVTREIQSQITALLHTVSTTTEATTTAGSTDTREATTTPGTTTSTTTETEAKTTILDALTDTLFSENVALDNSFERRHQAWAREISRIGGLIDTPAPFARFEESSHWPSHLVWHLPGAAGRLRVEIQLTPENRPRIQDLRVAADKH